MAIKKNSKKSKNNKKAKSKREEETVKRPPAPSIVDDADDDELVVDDDDADDADESIVDDEDEDEDEEDDDNDAEEESEDDDEDGTEDEAETSSTKKKRKYTRSSVSWKAKQLKRLTRVHKSLDRLNRTIGAAKPPGVDASGVEAAYLRIGMNLNEVMKLADDWKPARGASAGTASKVGIGSVVSAKAKPDDADAKGFFSVIPAALFTKGTVTYNDGRNWLVKCSDGVVRGLRKKYATLA